MVIIIITMMMKMMKMIMMMMMMKMMIMIMIPCFCSLGSNISDCNRSVLKSAEPASTKPATLHLLSVIKN